ncbi:ribonuclease E, partial [Pseudoalteromonas sp. SMS1]|nr:ribonuclease E [Pseudoalteromonas sp. SMS1]
PVAETVVPEQAEAPVAEAIVAEQAEVPVAETVVAEQAEAPVAETVVAEQAEESAKSVEATQSTKQPQAEVANVVTRGQTSERVRFNSSAASPMTKASPSEEPENVVTPNAMPDELRTIIRSSSLGSGSKAPTARASAQMASPAPVE